MRMTGRQFFLGLSTFSVLAVSLSLHAAEPKAATAEAPPRPTTEQIDGWLRDLDSRFWAKREKATEALGQAGMPAIVPLRSAVHAKSLEVADRSVGVLEQLVVEGDRSVQLAALESLVEAGRFPASQLRAERQLTELHERICCDRFSELGARVRLCHQRLPSVGRQTKLIVTIEPESWKGDASTFEQLVHLRRLDWLKINAPCVDDQVVEYVANLKSLRTLELVNTQVSLEMIDKIKEERSLLQLIVRSKSYLGVRFWPGGSLEVIRVETNSPASKAGMEVGDELMAFGGEKVESFDTLTARIAQHPPGSEVAITIRRGDETLEVKAVLEAKDWSTSE